MATEAEIDAEYVQLFQMYDKEGKGFISHDTLKEIVKEAGIELSSNDWELILDGVEENIGQDKFKTILSSCCLPPFNATQITNAFKVFDKAETNVANYGELKYVLTTLGKGIPRELIEAF